jgi:hypothetical protein
LRKAQIISGFAGIGKSTVNQNKSYDCESSFFSKSSEFPANYINYIKSILSDYDYIFISCHDKVRKSLQENEINYTIIYPSIQLKQEYLQRYKQRGSPESFIDLMSQKWEIFIDQIEQETFPKKIELQSGQYLQCVLERGIALA